MRTNDDYILREIAGEYLLVSTGNSASDFNGMITLNEMAAFIWRNINVCENEEAIITRILEEYNADSGKVEQDVHELLAGLKRMGMVTE